jgi:predicted RNase H-like HicB family nuclease
MMATTGILTGYIRAAMKRATYEIVEDDSSYWGEIPGVEGVWANEKTLEECREELQSVLESWILVSLVNDFPIPSLDGIELTAVKVN